MSLTDQYAQMHERGKYFPGYSISDYVADIADLVRTHQPKSMLDYGCGRGLQYLKRRVHEEWGGLLPHCYDPGVNGLQELPAGTFGGVLCVDVLEHIEEGDLRPVLEQLIACTHDGGFLFVVISCRPTRKRLPDGRDVHVTIKPPSWWKTLIVSVALTQPHRRVRISVRFDVAGHFDEPETPWGAWV